MAMNLVDAAEVVQVEEQHGQTGLVCLALGDGLGDAVGQQGPVGQPGERVVHAGLLQALPGLVQTAVRNTVRSCIWRPNTTASRAMAITATLVAMSSMAWARLSMPLRAAPQILAVCDPGSVHGGVVHADDRQPHQHGGQWTQAADPARCIAQAVGQPQCGGCGGHRDGQRCRQPAWVIHDAGCMAMAAMPRQCIAAIPLPMARPRPVRGSQGSAGRALSHSA